MWTFYCPFRLFNPKLTENKENIEINNKILNSSIFILKRKIQKISYETKVKKKVVASIHRKTVQSSLSPES